MVNRSTALKTNYTLGNYPINNKSNLRLTEKKDLQLIQIATWPELVHKVGKEIASSINLDNYALPNEVITNKSVSMMRIEPLKWWIVGSGTTILPDHDFTLLDLSHSFTNIEISGSQSIIFLNRHLPLDLREKSFPVNSIASSSIHHVSVKLWHAENGYQLFIPRGFALSLWEIFLKTASQFGYEIR